jgi:hypothetical protein
MLPQLGVVVKSATYCVTGAELTMFEISCIVGLLHTAEIQGSETIAVPTCTVNYACDVCVG